MATTGRRTRAPLLRRVGAVRVGDVMSRSPITVPPNAIIGRARKAAERNDVQYLLVTFPDGRPGAICMHHLTDAPRDALVGDCICDASWVGPLEPQLSVAVAAEVMSERAFRCMAVHAGPLLLGVVTAGDLRRAGLPEEEVRPRCTACGTRFHVLSQFAGGAIPICMECAERAQPPDPFDEIGDVD
jgi:CBS domain-containing protein